MTNLREVQVLDTENFYSLIEKWNLREVKPFADPFYEKQIKVNLAITLNQDVTVNETIAAFLSSDKSLLGISTTDAVSLVTHPTGSIRSTAFNNFESLARTAVTNAPLLETLDDVGPKIYYPANEKISSQIIMMLFNELGDPAQKVELLYGSQCFEAGVTRESMLVTYYLSCISFVLKVDLVSLFKGSSTMVPLVLLKTILTNKKTTHDRVATTRTNTSLPLGYLYFHALFGAFALCRSCSSKADLVKWCTTRYNSLMSSLTMSVDANIRFSLAESGKAVNNLAANNRELKALAAELRPNPLVADIPRVIGIKNHIKMLTDYAGMTTYLFIIKVISYGGPVLCLDPIPQQLLKYVTEREKVSKFLAEKGLSPDSDYIPRLNIMFPEMQFYKSADYPDMVVVAKEIERKLHPDQKNIDAYTSRTNEATIHAKQVRTFLNSSSGTGGVGVLDAAEMERLKNKLGIDLSLLSKEADKIIKRIQNSDNNFNRD